MSAPQIWVKLDRESEDSKTVLEEIVAGAVHSCLESVVLQVRQVPEH